MRLAERWIRRMVAWTPRDFRQRHGEDLVATYRTRAGDAAAAGGWAAAGLDVRELAGVLWLLIRLRVSPDRARAAGDRGDLRPRRSPWTDGLLQDVRFAGRMLRRNPGYAAAAIVVLALGIGPTSAMFSAVNAYFFRPLPFGDADRLAMLYETNPEFDWTDAAAAPANVLDWREQVDAFDDVAAYSDFVYRATYVVDGEPVLFGVTSVTGNFFSVLGVPPVQGRMFNWEETWDGRDDVVVLSHALWTTHFGADPSIVGRVIEIGGNKVEVVGVAPAGFNFPSDRTQLWTPWGWREQDRDAPYFRRAHWVRPIARLKPGYTHEQANTQLQVVVQRLSEEYPATNRVMGAGMMPLRDFLIRSVRSPLLILLGAVGLLLLLACANVANLTLVRSSERLREVALRHALGAGRARVARQMITESVVLGLAGGALGLGIGWIGVRGMARLTPLGIEGATSIALDVRVLLVTFLAATASALLFGIAPALRAAGGDVHSRLAEGGRSGTGGPASVRMTSFLVAAEVALALLLVAGAGLMTRSFSLMRQVDPGFRTEGVLAVQFSVPSARYANRDQVLSFYDRFAEVLEARPGIERVGTVGQLPLNGTSWSSQFQARGWPPERVGLEILHRRADPGYFEALGIPLIRGRMFDASDRPDGPLAVVINETFAREHFPNEEPLGQWIAYDRAATDSSNWQQIVGIVADQNQVSPTQPARAEVFENRNQDWARTNWTVIRTAGDPLSMMPTVRAVLKEMDPLIPIGETRPLREVWHASMAREEFILTLLMVFGGVALLLATVGVYAVTTQAARKRTHEIGIRMALGAARRDVVALMLRRSLLVVGIGLGAGLATSLVATRALGSVLYGIEPTDPLTLGSVAALLAAIALVACYVPARRATGVDPASSLRAD